jgi:hypothetical protein
MLLKIPLVFFARFLVWTVSLTFNFGFWLVVAYFILMAGKK